MISTVACAAPADQPGRDDLGVVEHQQVARPQQLRQIGDTPVAQPAGRRQDQQPRRVARLGRAVGDQLARQVEIEIVEMHVVRPGHSGETPPAA